MQNDVLKNEIAPWQEKGRWYHAQLKCENNTWSLVLENSDKLFKNKSVLNNNSFWVTTKANNNEKCVVDHKEILNGSIVQSQSFNRNLNTFYLSEVTSRTYLMLPTASTYNGVVDAYFFIV